MNLPKLRSFNVSNNNLTGPIPASLQSFTTGSFLGNSLLCGPPLAPCSGGPAPSPLPQTPPQKPLSPTLNSEKKISTGMTIAIAAGILTFLLIAALTVLLCLLKNRGKKEDGDMAVESKAAKSSNCGKGEKLTEQYGSGAQEAERDCSSVEIAVRDCSSRLQFRLQFRYHQWTTGWVHDGFRPRNGFLHRRWVPSRFTLELHRRYGCVSRTTGDVHT
ncbi:hypothetical protein ZOSMA_8G00890 [Zostera marina]|uniref:Uncharacterized protein n=1 Tax=Zostera marina TaxID=29655 RepID=A0A0K9NJJ6_ZOSMR|nr:hypothetical protein ZOSMA_8G00890 [Zostera marina]